MSFSEAFVAKRVNGRSRFYEQMDRLIDWNRLAAVIGQHYAPGRSAVGREAYSGLLLFKMLLVGIWNGLSDREVEEEVAVNLKVMRFCGLGLEDEVPDHSVLSRFRSALSRQQAFERLLEEINAQLEEQDVLVKRGVAAVDASVTLAPRRPRQKPAFEIAQDRQEDDREPAAIAEEKDAVQVIEVRHPGVDNEARWLNKGGQPVYGYKQHTLVDGNGLVIGVITTPANVHDSQPLEPLLDRAELASGTRVYMDKAYRSKARSERLKARGLKNGMHYRAARNRPLTKRQRQFNRGISRVRYKVERTFGGMKRWFGAGLARYVGLAKTGAQHVLEAMAYNLKRLPRLWVEVQMKRADASWQDHYAWMKAMG